MSKAMLIMDMPESCSKCKLFFDSYTDMICRGNHRTINYPYPDKKVQAWCPLRKVPKKMAEETRWFDIEYAKGWNACIDEILGGKDEKQRTD